VLDEFATGQQRDRALRASRELHLAGPDEAQKPGPAYFGIAPDIAAMLDWFIRHYPAAAGRTIGAIIGDAEDRMGIPRDVTERSLAGALDLDGKLGQESLQEFLRRTMTPAATASVTSRR
jgi:hypothetical protein